MDILFCRFGTLLSGNLLTEGVGPGTPPIFLTISVLPSLADVGVDSEELPLVIESKFSFNPLLCDNDNLPFGPAFELPLAMEETEEGAVESARDKFLGMATSFAAFLD